VLTIFVDPSLMIHSETPPIVVGSASVNAINALFDPPATCSKLNLISFVDCYATAPLVGVISSGLC
jgi:hypothetical protein